LDGARRALGRMDDGAGGVPRCPRGHVLGAALSPPGTECSICCRAAAKLSVVIQCGRPGCFSSCARTAGCAPRNLVMVMSALTAKFDPDSDAVRDNG
jgi:hypothetical protein